MLSNISPTVSGSRLYPNTSKNSTRKEDSGIRLNAQLEALVCDFTLEEVKNAIAYYRQTKRTKESKGQTIDRPAGWLTESASKLVEDSTTGEIPGRGRG